MSTPQKVTTDSWRPVLSSAIALLAGLEQRGFGTPDVVMGGGTVLMLRFQHRLSRDIDLFLHEVQWLSLLTPRLNEHAAALAADYVEQANSIKLVTRAGDIDFIVAAPVFADPPVETLPFMGRTLPLERTEEILGKKLLYRAEYLKPRDIFDLAVAAKLDPAAAERALTAAAPKHDAVRRRLDYLSRLSLADLAGDIVPLGDFSTAFGHMIEDAQALLERCRNAGTEAEEQA